MPRNLLSYAEAALALGKQSDWTRRAVARGELIATRPAVGSGGRTRAWIDLADPRNAEFFRAHHARQIARPVAEADHLRALLAAKDEQIADLRRQVETLTDLLKR